MSGEAASQKLDRFTDQNSKTINQDTRSNIKQHPTNQSMRIDNFKDNIQNIGNNLKQQHKEITSENAIQYKAVKSNNKTEESIAQKQVGMYEEDRLGKSVGIGAPDSNLKTTIPDKIVYEQAKNIKSKNE